MRRRDVASRLGLDPDTVARYADAASVETLIASKHQISKLDPFKDHLDRRWNAGCVDAARLTREIRELGYRGTDRTVRRYLQPLRASGSPAAHTLAPPKPRKVTGWITRHPDKVSADERAQLKAILVRCPHLDILAGLVTDFAKILCGRHGERLPAWLEAAETADLPDLHAFTVGLRRDLVAVTNGLTLPWSSGPVEGNVCRIKAIKRSMFGRAGFGLLRKRVLLIA